MNIWDGPWLALAPLAALVIVLLWPYAGRLKLASARARARRALARAADIRAQKTARAREAALQHERQKAMAAEEARRQLEALRAVNRTRWQDREPAARAAIDVINILLAEHGTLSLEPGRVQAGPDAAYGVRCAIIAHDRPNGYVGTLLLQIDRDLFIAILQWPGHETGPCVRDVAAGMGVSEIADLIAEALRPLTGATVFGALPTHGPAQASTQRGFA